MTYGTTQKQNVRFNDSLDFWFLPLPSPHVATGTSKRPRIYSMSCIGSRRPNPPTRSHFHVNRGTRPLPVGTYAKRVHTKMRFLWQNRYGLLLSCLQSLNDVERGTGVEAGADAVH